MFEKFQKYKYENFGYILMPEIKLKQEELDIVAAKSDCSNLEFLKKLVWKGLNEKIPKQNQSIYIERIKIELDTVTKLGFIDYFLLVWRVMNFADKNQIAHGRGRGSMASSVILYLLKCSGVDPITYNLLFARFLSAARAKSKIIDGKQYIDGNLLADCDLDFESGKYHLIIDYLKSLYPSRICKISGYAELTGKILCKELCKIALNFTEETAKFYADKIPKDAGFVWTISEACEGKKRKDSDEWEKEPVLEFQKFCKDNPEFYSLALGLKDLLSHSTVHPAGWLISYHELDTHLPTRTIIDSNTGKSELACSFDMTTVVNFATKLDLLRVRTCAVISKVLKMTCQDEFSINLDSDPIIYDNLQNLMTPMGLFQIESSFNYQVLKAIKPKNLNETMDVLSIARPGAYSSLGEYVENSPKFSHPILEKVLKDTRGVCLYQESLLRLLVEIGFTADEAEVARKVVGKKLREKVQEWKEKIFNKAKENGHSEELAKLIWDTLEASASYSFARSHACSYAALTALTVYLKFKYPLEFFTALLQESRNEPNPIEEITKINRELQFFDIQLLAPDLSKRNLDFEIEGKNIRFGLQSIKGVSDKTIAAIQQFHPENGNRLEMFEAAEQAGLNIGVFSAMIHSGCMDSFLHGKTRSNIVLQCQLFKLLTKKEKVRAFQIAKDFNYDVMEICRNMRATKDEKGKQYLAESRRETIYKTFTKKKEIYDNNKQFPDIVNGVFEWLLLGFMPTGRIYEYFSRQNDQLMSIYEVNETLEDEYVKFVGMVSDKAISKISKNKNRYLKLQLMDNTGICEIMYFNQKDRKTGYIQDKIAEIERQNEGKLPSIQQFYYIEGKKKGDIIFASKISKQKDLAIYWKYSDEFKKNKEKELESVM